MIERAQPIFADHPQHLASLVDVLFHAVDPAEAVRRSLARRGDSLLVGAHIVTLEPEARVWVTALGKAAPAMAAAAARILGNRLAGGVATLPGGLTAPDGLNIQFIRAGHPLPDRGSLAAGEATRRMLSAARPQDVSLVLVSGGGSAMLEIPRPGLSLEDLQSLQDMLMRSRADVAQINVIRTALSQSKGGGLARMANPARTIGLVLSDVVGDPLPAIASGPTVPTADVGARARRILESLDMLQALPGPCLAALDASVAPVPGPKPLNVVIASNALALQAMCTQGEKMGFAARVVTAGMQGETHDESRSFCRQLRAASAPACLLQGGETTLEVRTGGRGGRNQSFALQAALALEGSQGRILAALATDGVDGPTDAAGAIVSGATAGALRRVGVDIDGHIRRRDAYPALRAGGCLIHSLPSGTNVGDILIGLAYRL